MNIHDYEVICDKENKIEWEQRYKLWNSNQVRLYPSRLITINYFDITYKPWLEENKINYGTYYNHCFRAIRSVNFSNEEDAALFLLKWN